MGKKRGMNDDLTVSQRAVLDAVTLHVASKGYPPTVRDIGSMVGLKSASSVHRHLKSLERLGYLERAEDRPRGIKIVGGPEDVDRLVRALAEVVDMVTNHPNSVVREEFCGMAEQYRHLLTESDSQ